MPSLVPVWVRLSRDDRDRKYRKLKFTASLHDYELISPIGGIDDMSYMYLAFHRPTRTQVALKYTDLSISPDIEFVDELTTIVNTTMRYRHTSLLPYFKSFIEDDRLWTVTLPMKAGSCRSVLDTYFPNGISETAVVTIIKYLLRALDYLHDQGVVHNDIRADNIMIDFCGDVRVVGLHQISNLAEARPSAFDYVGLPEWMAPELFEQQVSFNPRSDIYSLGITALELATGKTPYHQWPPLKIMVAKLKYLAPVSENEVNKGKHRPYSRHFFEFVRACLNRDPAARPHAHELLKHPLLKKAKGASYVVSRLVKRTNLKHKHSNTSNTPNSSPQLPNKPAQIVPCMSFGYDVDDTDHQTTTSSNSTSLAPSLPCSVILLTQPSTVESAVSAASASTHNLSKGDNQRRKSFNVHSLHGSTRSCLAPEPIEMIVPDKLSLLAHEIV